MMEAINSFSALPTWSLAIAGFVLGAIVGSYFATILARWPRGESANRGRSRCDSCSRQLKWFELVPLISALVLGETCRTCGAGIHRQHFLTELTFAVATSTLLVLQAPLWIPLGWLLIILGAFDALYLWLPDRLTLILAVLALALPPLDSAASVIERILAGAGTYAVMILVAAGFRRLTGRTGLGQGDAKLMGAMALWAGPLQTPIVLLVGCSIGLADAVVRVAGGRNVRNVQLPLGTYLCLSALLLMIFTQVFLEF
ncbi:MAG: prepilin peptidase [Alteraurantiacibacter sp.]